MRISSLLTSRGAAAFTPILLPLMLAATVLVASPSVPAARAQSAPPAAASTPPKAKITANQAKAAAVKKIHGKATSAKYEFEDGHWQYAVIVKTKKGEMYEVEVDATTGKVTDSEKTSPGEEAKEEAADKKKAAAPAPAAKADKDDKDDEKGGK